VTAAVATIAAAAVCALPGLTRSDPLPTLRNDAGWRTHGLLVPPQVGARLLGPVEDDIWLVRGSVPGGGDRAPTVAQALLDLHGLTGPNGAVAAGADGPWTYTWPRDTAFVAAAYAASGHLADARRALGFLARVQLPDGGFEARYRLDGSGPPDDRPRQTDGAGWVLWSLEQVREATADGVLPDELRPLRDRAYGFVLAQTASGTRLPAVSPDYWEVPERRLTLGTAAPLAAGLESAASTYGAEGNPLEEAEAARAAGRLRDAIRDEFGPDYQRHGHTGGLDASVAMLMPPFAHLDDPAAARAWEHYPLLALRDAGGLAPGQEWKRDGVSWTPETAMVAYTAAASGHVELAERWLDWLEAHRTTWGSLPEKVLPDGSPAGPAPLAWTAALVVLTEHELDVRRRGVGTTALGSAVGTSAVALSVPAR
jgi:GH15 family glucan-1,4-alpha-glucosidase